MKAKRHIRDEREANRINWIQYAVRKSKEVKSSPAPVSTSVSAPASTSESAAAHHSAHSESVSGKTPASVFYPMLEDAEGYRLLMDSLRNVNARAEKLKDIPQEERKDNQPWHIPCINIKDDMPTTDIAVRRFLSSMTEFRKTGVRVFKVIHGHGSTGLGGKIRVAVREELAVLKSRKRIADYIIGEDFDPTNPVTRRLLGSSSRYAKDYDYGQMNPGMVIVILKL